MKALKVMLQTPTIFENITSTKAMLQPSSIPSDR